MNSFDSDFCHLLLYYPNLIKQRDSDQFNWFEFSTRVYDNDLELYYIYLPSNVQFFCPHDGKTLTLKNSKSKILILNDPNNKIKFKKLVYEEQRAKMKDYLKNLGFNGYVVITEYNSYVNQNTPLLKRLQFMIINDNVEELKENYPKKCFFVLYSKKFNTFLKNIIPSFPSCDEIDRMYQNIGCSKTSLELYYKLLNIDKYQTHNLNKLNH